MMCFVIIRIMTPALFFVSSRRKAQSVNPDDIKAKPTYTENQVGNPKVSEAVLLVGST
jgi:uracil-DNA glycosylase